MRGEIVAAGAICAVFGKDKSHHVMGVTREQLRVVTIVDHVVRWTGDVSQRGSVNGVTKCAEWAQYEPRRHRDIRIGLRSHARIVGGDPAAVGRSEACPTPQMP